MAHVGRHGYPVPEVFGAHGTDLIMERIDGPTMARALIDGELGIDHFVALARLLDRALAIRLGNRTMSPDELAALPTAAARVQAAADANHRRDND